MVAKPSRGSVHSRGEGGPARPGVESLRRGQPDCAANRNPSLRGSRSDSVSTAPPAPAVFTPPSTGPSRSAGYEPSPGPARRPLPASCTQTMAAAAPHLRVWGARRHREAEGCGERRLWQTGSSSPEVYVRGQPRGWRPEPSPPPRQAGSKVKRTGWGSARWPAPVLPGFCLPASP